MDRIEVTIHGVVFTAALAPLRTPYGYKAKRTRVYVHGGYTPVDFSDLEAIEGWANDKSLTPEFNRRNRQVTRNMRLVITERRAGLLAAGWDEVANAAEGNLTFSRYAGCSCPCSPGFIAAGVLQLPDGEGRMRAVEDVWIDSEEVVRASRAKAEEQRDAKRASLEAAKERAVAAGLDGEALEEALRELRAKYRAVYREGTSESARRFYDASYHNFRNGLEVGWRTAGVTAEDAKTLIDAVYVS